MGLPGAEEILRAPWIEIATSTSPVNPTLERACRGLGAGERSAILLAESLPADLVLLDEWKARRIAREAGLTITGCLAVLRKNI
jgi:predicted nucleic acid-binding protein